VIIMHTLSDYFDVVKQRCDVDSGIIKASCASATSIIPECDGANPVLTVKLRYRRGRSETVLHCPIWLQDHQRFVTVCRDQNSIMCNFRAVIRTGFRGSAHGIGTICTMLVAGSSNSL
jgi:hypothetical protein